MCSILGILDIKTDANDLRKRALKLSKRMRHRGPDWSGIYAGDRAILVHERLAIVDLDNGAQPLYDPTRSCVLAVNGEIYNHRDLAAGLSRPYEFQTASDCEVILALYKERGPDFLDDLNGIFAFVLFDESDGSYLVARDHMGICPLYTGHDANGNFYVASEMKALTPVCTHIEVFPPGHLLWSKEGKPRRYYTRAWQSYENVANAKSDKHRLRSALEDAVKRQLMSDVPYGVLLSGGLDSSIVSAITQKFAARRIEDGEKSPAWWPRLHSFAIGLKGAPDLAAAREVANHLGTIHHELHFTVQEGLDAVRDVIYHIESCDVTTVRASTPMYLMARRIKAMGIKMVLSGEGSDEIFGGYLYFHKAPNAQEFHEETVRKLEKLYLFDCLRANKSMAAWGVEARVPFLDKEFMDVAMSLCPEDKRCGGGKIEKQILREAFSHYLPESVAWRQKEQFSDGVGYSWIDTLKEVADREVSDHQMETAPYRFPVNTPDSKEAYYYRELFEEHFGSNESVVRTVPHDKSVACSTPVALRWDRSFLEQNDPSGRAVDAHCKAYFAPAGRRRDDSATEDANADSQICALV